MQTMQTDFQERQAARSEVVGERAEALRPQGDCGAQRPCLREIEVIEGGH